MADFAAILAAIATKCGATSGVNFASATKLESIPDSPGVVVTGFTIDYERGMGLETASLNVSADLLVAKPGDLADALALVYTLVESLRVAARTGTQLGYAAYVQDSWIERAETGKMEYGGNEYVGAKLTWRVLLWETAVERTA